MVNFISIGMNFTIKYINTDNYINGVLIIKKLTNMRQISLSLFLILTIVGVSYGQAKVGAFGEIIVDNSAPVPDMLLFSKANTRTNKKKVESKQTNKSTRVQLAKITTQEDKVEEVGQTSYKVKIMTVDSPLDLTHHIFTSYENVNFSQSKARGYTYFSGEYTDEKEAMKVLEKIQRVYPKALIITEKRMLPIPGK